MMQFYAEIIKNLMPNMKYFHILASLVIEQVEMWAFLAVTEQHSILWDTMHIARFGGL